MNTSKEYLPIPTDDTGTTTKPATPERFQPVTFADERRLKHPARWKRIDAGQSPTGAIVEFCRQCMQTDTNVRDCPARSCPLFPYRPGADAPDAVQRTSRDVPSQSDYERMIEVWRAAHPEAAERAKALGGARSSSEAMDLAGVDPDAWEA